MSFTKRIRSIALLSALIGSPALADFTYEGYLTTNAGVAVTDAAVTFKIAVLNPAKDCILYEESQIVNLTGSTTGYYALSIGSAPGAAKRTASDSNNAFETVFASGTVSGKQTSDGTTPCGPSLSVGDARYLRVTVTPSGTGVAETLAPDLSLNSASRATVAETLDGVSKSQLVRINSVGPVALTQGNLETIFTIANLSKLSNLLALDLATLVQTPAGGGMTVPSSSVDPASAAVGQMWFDSTSGSLKYKDTGGITQTVSTSGGGALPPLSNGSLWVGNGLGNATAVVPSGDVTMDNSGAFMYAGTVPVNKGGSGATSLSPNGLLMMNGIGTAMTSMSCSINQILKYNGTVWSCAGLSGLAASGSPAEFGTSDSQPLYFGTNGLTRMTVDSNGNVGIGTNAPSSLLMVRGPGGLTPVKISVMNPSTTSGAYPGLFLQQFSGSTSTGPVIAMQSARGDFSAPTVNSLNDKLGSLQALGYDGSAYGTSARIDLLAGPGFSSSNTTGVMTFSTTQTGTSPTEAMRIDSTGYVGVGGTTFDTKFSVMGASSAVYSESSGSVQVPSGAQNFAKIMNGSLMTGSGSYLVMESKSSSSNTNRAYIGTISGASYVPSIVIGSSTGAAAYSEKLRIDGSGKVGIGTAAPTAKMSLYAPSSSQDMFSAQCGAGGFCQGYYQAGSVRLDSGADDSGNRVFVGSQTNSDFDLKTNDLTRMRIASSGNIGIGINNPSVNLDVLKSGAGVTLQLSNIGTNAAGMINLQGATGTVGAPGASPLNGNLGQIMFAGHDGTAYASGALIASIATQAWTSSPQHGSALSFQTIGNSTAGGPIERLRIDHNGDIGIGTNAPTNDYSATTVHVHASGSSAVTHYTNSPTGPSAVKGAYVGYVSGVGPNPAAMLMARGSSDDVILGTLNNIRLLVSSSGNVGVGVTNPSAKLEVGGTTKLNGHVTLGGGSTSVASCGGSASITGNDSRGTVMIGSTGGTSCQVTFNSAFGSNPVCVVSWADASPPSYQISGTSTTTELTVYFSSSVASKSFNYICVE